MQLALGTVQFGLDYGIGNLSGQVDSTQTQTILSQAWDHKIHLLDTAHAYGNAEVRIGNYCQHHPDQGFKIVTKLSSHCVDELLQQFFISLNRLQKKCIYAILLHSIEDLRKKNAQSLWEKLVDLKTDGLILKIGASVYHPHEVDFLLENFDIDIIQIPLNVLDHRGIDQLGKLQQRNIEIHVRSVFLQGLLLMPILHAISKQPQSGRAIEIFHHICNQHQITPLQACLSFIQQQAAINHVVIGAQSSVQLDEIIRCWQWNKNLSAIDFSACSQTDLSIIDPSRWHR